MTESMKAIVYEGPENMVLEDIQKPVAGPDDVVIRVKYVSICGGDMHSYRCGYGSKPGRVLGHEYCGYVDSVGKNVQGVGVGDRVWGMQADVCGACWYCQNGDYGNCSNVLESVTGHGKQGAMAEYLKIGPVSLGNNLHKIPDSIPDLEATLIEPFTVGHDMVAGNVELGDNVLVIGAGMVGNAIMQFAKLSGAASVTMSDVSDYRLDMAKQCGADHVINSAKEDVLEAVQRIYGPNRWYYGESGRCDVGFETAGVANTVNDVIGAVKAGGKVVLVAPSERDVNLNLAQLINKYQQIVLPLGGSGAEETIKAMAEGKLLVEPLIAKIFPYTQATEAFENQANPENGMKTIIQMDLRSA